MISRSIRASSVFAAAPGGADFDAPHGRSAALGRIVRAADLKITRR